jgi:hypothetical protein
MYTLTVAQRIMLLAMLPKEGNLISLKIIRSLREELSFTEEEHKELEFINQPNGYVVWNTAKEKPKSFDFAPVTLSLIVDALSKKEKAQKLTEEEIPLFEMFVK